MMKVKSTNAMVNGNRLSEEKQKRHTHREIETDRHIKADRKSDKLTYKLTDTQ